ncbi:MAG: serine/threonine protein kinase [Gemmatimonadaceae bacterium]|nr:serine/threonine protein kinase [Gemmatimonadaceae bacterium]
MHRDIKPENVLLSSGTAVVADFGIAKAVSASRTQAPDASLTQAGMAIGTPAYMAPEQALGDASTDHRADVYAWGVLAFELLQGVHPFADRTTSAAMTAAHIATPAPAVTAPGTAPTVRALIARCLAKEPDGRPASMETVLTMLSSSAESLAAPRRTPSSPRTRRALGLVGLVVAAAGGAWWRTRAPSVVTDAPGIAAGDASRHPVCIRGRRHRECLPRRWHR